jgi:1-acyl-sn-glycerol-3-phosphate acyltransferase
MATDEPPGSMRKADASDAATVLATRSRFITWFMTAYMRRHARRHFHGVRLAHGSVPTLDPDQGVIVYTNHPSWWDPVMCVLLQARAFPRRRGYAPMEADALSRYNVLRRIGVFGLEPGTRRGAVQFLKVGAGILRTPNTVLWVTAEGSFTDPRQRPVQLRPGVAHLLHKHPNVVAIPLALEFPFWNESTPEALARFGDPIMPDVNRSVAEWDALLTERLTRTMDHLARDAMTRDAARFDSLVAGKVGVGGIYDLWRRLAAALRGQRARLEHEQPHHPQAVHRQAGHPQTGHPTP